MESSTSSSCEDTDTPFLTPRPPQYNRDVLPPPATATSMIMTDTPNSVVDEFQILYKTERSTIDRMKIEKEAKEVWLRSLMASVTESEAAVAIIRNDLAKSLSPRKKVSFSQQEEVFLQPSMEATTPTENLRKFLVEDDDAISEITDHYTVGSHRSHGRRNKGDIPRTPPSISNVVIAAEEEWLTQDQPMFQIKRSPANEQSKRIPLSKDELERQPADLAPCDDSTVTNDVESQAVEYSEYTERLHSGYSLTSSSSSSHLRGMSSLSTEGTLSQHAGYTQFSTSDTSSQLKDSTTSSSLGPLTTHTEEASDDAVGDSLQSGCTLETSFVEKVHQPALSPDSQSTAADVAPWHRMSGDVSDSHSSVVHFDSASTSAYSDDAVVGRFLSSDTIATFDSAYHASREQQTSLQGDQDLLEEAKDIGSAALPSEMPPQEADDALEPSSPQASKSKKKKKKSVKKLSSHKLKGTGSLVELNDLSAHTGRSTETGKASPLMTLPEADEFALQSSEQRTRFSTDKSASDAVLMTREHQVATGRIRPPAARLSKSEPMFAYHASSNIVVQGIPVGDEEAEHPSRLVPNHPSASRRVSNDFSGDGVSALTGDHSLSLEEGEARDQFYRDPSSRSGLIGVLGHFTVARQARRNSRRNEQHWVAPTRNDASQTMRAIIAASEDTIADFEEYCPRNPDTSQRYETSQKSRKIFWSILCMLLFLAFMIPIGIFSARQNEAMTTATPSAAPVAPMTRDEMVAVLSVLLDDGGAALEYDGTPQFQAVSWLLETSNEPLIVSTESQLVQRYALATIYFSLGGEEWDRNEKWMTEEHERFWFSKSENPFQGDTLVDLNLSFNGLKGEIPGEIGLLSGLTTINLSGNAISDFPKSLSMLRNTLQSLKLNDNQLSGSLPMNIGDLPYLETLDLSVNGLTGVIPTEIGRNSNMKELSLSLNGLFGQIPSEIGKLSLLCEMDVRENMISGSLPVELFALTNLKHLAVADNRMVMRKLSTEIGTLTGLTSLSMGNCGLSGVIPSEIGQLYNIKAMSLPSNNLTGSIPSTIAGALSLVSLNFSFNGLTGVIPSEMGLLQNLKSVSVERNFLNGTIPAELSYVKSFEAQFNFRENKLTGSVPLEFCQQSCCAKGEILVDVSAVVPCETDSACLNCPGYSESVELDAVP